jgi:hypothetical protein
MVQARCHRPPGPPEAVTTIEEETMAGADIGVSPLAMPAMP